MRTIHSNTQDRISELNNFRRNISKLEKASEAGSELKNTYKTLEGDATNILHSYRHDSRNFQILFDSLSDSTRSMLMTSYNSMFEGFPTLVRDLSRKQGKEVRYSLRGPEVELDRRILNAIHDSLIHILRNAIDHGLEKPEIRERKGKNRVGKIEIVVTSKPSSEIEFSISDDGTGIDLDSLKKSILSAGLASQEAVDQMPPSEIYPYIFHSGISTSPEVSEISGRGLGLSIVQEKAAMLGGSVSFATEIDKGTQIKMTVPTTVLNSRGILIRVSNRIFAIQTVFVERVVSIPKLNIRTIENKSVTTLGGEALSLVDLAHILGIEDLDNNERKNLSFVVLKSDGRRIAFKVDEVLREQEIFVKGLGQQIRKTRNISGVTVLGSETVIPILNVADLIQSCANMELKPIIELSKKRIVDPAVFSLLVVEDSLTTRTLMKTVLESNGYTVETANDGVDAFTILKTRRFDLVLSDVDMPRMDGYKLTQKIRADKKLEHIPIILVSSNDSREARERGIEVGANFYMAKSSFDQTELIELIGRLIGG